MISNDGGIDGREKTSTMYCSDSAFAIYEFNNQEEIKRRWTIFLQLGGTISIIEKYIWEIEREEDARKNA